MPHLEPPPFADEDRPDYDFIPLPDDYVPDDAGHVPDLPPPEQDGLQGLEPPEPADDTWAWHDARLIGLDRGAESGDRRFEVGVIDLYANSDTGDLGGSYLPLAAFPHEPPGAAFFHALQARIHEQGVAPYEVPAFAEQNALLGDTQWRAASRREYAAYEHLRDLEAADRSRADDPPEAALDPLLQTAMDLGGVLVERELEPAGEPEPDAACQALGAIGLRAEDFDPARNPPPFHDPQTGAACWIGIFQPDPDARDHCVTSLLSLARDPDSGQLEAQLAPCVPGDWDKAFAAAQYLIQVAQRGDLDRVFETAEGMALATDERALWEGERGLPVEPDTTRRLADVTRAEWEVDL